MDFIGPTVGPKAHWLAASCKRNSQSNGPDREVQRLFRLAPAGAGASKTRTGRSSWFDEANGASRRNTIEEAAA